jgi:hypothetical protein
MTPEHHHSVAEELHDLAETADRGESAATPAILVGEVFMFLLPIAFLLLSAAFAAYYLA